MNQLKPIETRSDISFLVQEFYKKVRLDEEIGYFFTETIVDWDEHLEKLSDFWESNLLGVNKFSGRPGYAHIKVDQKFNHSIEAKHFGVWLNLWFKTIDENFTGELAEKAKYFARNLGSNFHLKIFAARGN